MPTFNQCAFIRRAILSLMRQTYANWELIIINDGCTDETEEYISDYLDDPRVTYIKNDENMGLGHALNQALILHAVNILLICLLTTTFSRTIWMTCSTSSVRTKPTTWYILAFAMETATPCMERPK